MPGNDIDWTAFDLPPLEEVKDPDFAAKALLRHLYVWGPRDAEQAWADNAAKNRLRLAQGVIKQCWFEEKAADGTSRYTFVGDGVGRFQHERPSEAELKDALLILVEPQQPVPLREYLSRLIARLPEQNVIRRDRDRLLDTLNGCEIPAQALLPQTTFIRQYLAAARGEPAGDETPATPRAVAQAYLIGTLESYQKFMVPAPIAYRLILLTSLLGKVETPPETWLAVMAKTPPHLLMDTMLAEIAKMPNIAEFAVHVADELAGEAESYLAKAKEVGDSQYGWFIRHIFTSCPLFEAAYACCKWLLGYGTVKDEKQKKMMKQRSIGYEEETVLSQNAISIDTANAIDRRFFQMHRARIARARSEGGEAAAEIQWNDYSGRQRFYPAMWKPVLMGETDDIATRLPGA